MPTYNVHIYREMRLYYPGVEADTPEHAAEFASDLSTDMAAFCDDCDGQTLAALVDLDGDEEFVNSRLIDFLPSALALLDEADGLWRAAFADDQPVDGGDLVDWFAQWLVRVQAALAVARNLS